MKFKKKLLMITMAASMLLSSVSAFAAAVFAGYIISYEEDVRRYFQ